MFEKFLLNTRRWFVLTAAVGFLALTHEVEARVIHVSYKGNDGNSGTAEKPFKTLARAQAEVRKSSRIRNESLTVFIREGTYYLDNTLLLTAEDSGTPDAPVTWSAYNGEKVVISGGSKLDLSWQSYRGGIFRAKMPEGLKTDQLFINGKRQHMARYPNYDPDVLPYNGYAADAFSPERAARWADPTGGIIHAMHAHHWGGYHYRITGKQSDNTVIYEGGWQNNRQMGMHDEYRFVENIFEELDAPGEWFHDAKSQMLYYYPAKDVDLNSATVEISRLKHIVEFKGSQDKPVRFINLSGFAFRHAARTFMDTKEPLLRSDWTIYRGGAVMLTGAEDCAISDCEFDQVGGNAVFVSRYNRRVQIRGTHIHGAGASGVCFVGDPGAVRNPLFEYGQKQSYNTIDKTPGPKTDNYPADCIVDDCLIHSVSMVEKQASGVQISMSKGITVRHCSIYDIGRAGINISEGTFGGHVIEFCDVFDTVKETGDHGSFNSWGRDRFWHLEDTPGGVLPELALLDAEKTVIRNSRWRCDRGWDVDLDDGSSNYEIYNNVFLNGGLKLREGFHRKVYNNIGVNSTLHTHVWYENSMDIVTGNIWMVAYAYPILMCEGAWGKMVDRNFFMNEQHRTMFTAKKWDLNSLSGDPMFVDPENGDFRVKPNSPALNTGFKNFPMDRFGVQKPELKALARTPEIPELNFAIEQNMAYLGKDSPDKWKAEQWLGASVVPLSNEEYSAFGVGKDDGGIHLVSVPPKSGAGMAGLQSGDLIQAVNGKPVKDTAALLKAAGSVSAGQMIRLKVVRDQQARTITIPGNR